MMLSARRNCSTEGGKSLPPLASLQALPRSTHLFDASEDIARRSWERAQGERITRNSRSENFGNRRGACEHE